MPVIDHFKKRMRRQRGEMPDVYQYDKIPGPLRVQVVYVFIDIVDPESDRYAREDYGWIANMIMRELPSTTQFRKSDLVQTKWAFLTEVLFNTDDAEMFLSVIEIALSRFRYREAKQRAYGGKNVGLAIRQGIEELNIRFQENGLGYEFVNGQIIRIDSKHLHQEAIKPAIHLLHQHGFEGANDEFLTAHEHYRSQHYKEAMNACVKAFESTMKAICDKRGWEYDAERDTAWKLVEIMFEKKLLEGFMQNKINQLKSLLQTTPTPRNKKSGHGQGAEIDQVPEYFAQYMLNVTGSVIVLIVKAHEAMG